MHEAHGQGAEIFNMDMENTVKKYEEILETDPSSSTFVFLAQVLYKQNELDRASGVLLKGLRYNKNNITGRFLLGKIYYERWMIDLAKKELETVFELAPDNLAAGKMLVEIYKSEEDFDKALGVLMFVHEFHPSDEAIKAEINEINAGIENREKNEGRDIPSWQNFNTPSDSNINRRAEKTDPETDLTTETMADLYMEQGLQDKAVKIYENIIADDPNYKSVRNKLQEWRLKEANKAAGFTEEE